MGGEAMEVCLDPILVGWPEEWRWAVELFRKDGDLQLLRWSRNLPTMVHFWRSSNWTMVRTGVGFAD